MTGVQTCALPISAVSGYINVKGTNSCGIGGISNLAVTVNPLPNAAGTITGPLTACQGQGALTYKTTLVTNATSYVWTLPTGVTGTSTVDSIVANFTSTATSGAITVKGHNSCGDGTAASLNITVNLLPTTATSINGLANVCQGQSNIVYSTSSIANALTYVWTFPTGASGTSTTNTISLNYSASAASGNITVKGQNACGDGAVFSKAITVNTIPATPVITQNNNTLTSNNSIGNQWYNLATGLISGANAQQYLPQLIGNYFTIVTLNGCTSDSSNIIYYDNTGINNTDAKDIYIIYPNPVKDVLTVETNTNNSYNLEITNQLGQTIYSSIIKNKKIIDASFFAKGVYVIKLINNKESSIKMFVKE